MPNDYGERTWSLKKNESRKAAGLNEIPLELWKTRKFDSVFLWLYNTVYK